ncbi:MAG TPA: ECF-type sigma factor, partial [Pirellulales bacterium]|nr:ECF-type sigma factor [Pirellulales bacterium]
MAGFDAPNDNNIWRLLVVITARKALHAIRDQHRLRRGGGQILSETDLASEKEGGALANVISWGHCLLTL